MSKQRYVLQGLSSESNFLHEVKDILLDDSYTDVWLVSAFLNDSAVFNLKDAIQKSKANISCLIGIGNGVTSFQALSSLLKLKVKLYTIDTALNNSIFHVKEVLAYSSETARFICGSANLTTGGLAHNIEAGVISTLNLTDNDDRTFFEDVLQSLTKLTTEYPHNIVLHSVQSSIQELVESGRLEDEDNPPPKRPTAATSKHSLNTSAFPLQTATIKSRRKKDSLNYTTLVRNSANKVQILEFDQVWQSRALAKSNIGITDNPKTHPKGEMGLGKGTWKGSFDPQSYFKEDVFSQLTWTTNELGDSIAEAPFDLQILGVDHGWFTLQILHKRKGMVAAAQNNYLTSIRWGDAAELMRNRNLIGKTLKLYRSADHETFLIKIE